MKRITVVLLLMSSHVLSGEFMSHIYKAWMYGESDREAFQEFMFALTGTILFFILPGFVIFFVGGFVVRLLRVSELIQILIPYWLWVAGMTVFLFQFNPTIALVSNISPCLILSIAIFLMFRRSKQGNES